MRNRFSRIHPLKPEILTVKEFQSDPKQSYKRLLDAIPKFNTQKVTRKQMYMAKNYKAELNVKKPTI
jgi:hypothetical protein